MQRQQSSLRSLSPCESQTCFSPEEYTFGCIFEPLCDLHTQYVWLELQSLAIAPEHRGAPSTLRLQATPGGAVPLWRQCQIVGLASVHWELHSICLAQPPRAGCYVGNLLPTSALSHCTVSTQYCVQGAPSLISTLMRPLHLCMVTTPKVQAERS